MDQKLTLASVLCISIIGNSQKTYCQEKQIRKENKPNIIFILTDDHRTSAMGYAGNNIIKTPEMDQLARDGVYFRNAFSSTPISAASRASILSGLYERTHKYTFQTGPIREEYMQTSYPKVLREAGYYTGFYGKFGVNYDHLDRLFDVHEDYDRDNHYKDRRGYFYKTLGKDTMHLTRYTGEKAIQFIKDAPADKPFCLSISFSAPHAHDGAPEQYFWDEGTAGLYKDVVIPDPDLKDDKYFNALPKEVRDGFSRLRWGWRFDNPKKYQEMVKGYYRMISGVDLEIAKIRQQLKTNGQDKNTVIMLMGDNGYFLGERQLADKWMMYDLSINVPLIIYDPRVKKHQDIDAMALNLDIPSTIADLAGVAQPKSWHGKSLVPIVLGKTNNVQRDTVMIEHIWEFVSIPPSEGIRTNDWKYFRYVNDKSWEELYNLKNDPKEINNLATNPKYKKVLLDLRAKNDELAKKYADPYSGIPSGLMVEYIREPQNVPINDNKPEYSWIVPKVAVYQNAYQILVASSKANISNNIGDVWNSGQVRGKISTNVEHAGKPLTPNSKYFWKVRVWDKDNRLSEYSPIQEFKTGTFTGNVSTGNAFHIERVKPVKMEKTGTESYFVDFGKDAFGTLELDYNSPKDDTLTIRLGEKLLGKSIDRNPGGTIRYSEVKLAVKPGNENYTLKLVPDKRNTLANMAVILPDTFDVITPFRYCEIDNYESNLTTEKIRQIAYFNYFDESNSSFTSSDTILNQIWDLCKYSMKATTVTGLYIDGDRERIPYEGDAYINQLSHYAVDCEYPMAQQTIEWFMRKPTWPTEWQQHVALLFWQDYMYSGNTELIKKYYEPLKHKTLMALDNEEGIVSTKTKLLNGVYMATLGFADTTQRLRDIVDWPPAQKDTNWKLPKDWPQGERDGFEFMPFNTVINSFYYQNLIIMAEFARLLNKTGDELDFRFRAERTKKAINEKMYNKNGGFYADGIGSDHGSVHANMLPLAFGIVPEEYRESVVKHVKSRGMGCSVYGAQFLLDGLYNAGAADYALSLMTATHDRSWYNMIKVGSTITMEAWDMKYKPNSDWNHAWGGAPGNIIQRQLWGITPKTPGFGVVQVKPQLGNLKHSSIIVPTIKGEIKASYKWVNARIHNYEIELPANTGGEMVIPEVTDAVVTVNGQAVNPVFKSIRLEPGKNHIEIRVNSF